MQVLVRKAGRAQRTGWRGVHFVLLLLFSNCGPLGYVKCLEDLECANLENAKGRCLMSSYGPFCAFPDKECPSMWRWGELSNENIVNECVDPSVPLDAAIDLSPVDMSPSQGG